MFSKTITMREQREDWCFIFDEGDDFISVRHQNTFIDFMSLEDLEALVEFKKAIDDLA